mmetsp:Transcript_88844/g.247300  ORF Transcript_88844/g.247300 Transcript_88844/m.247300 type:complete len:202 (-) Transcript_88844:48-653(-)
MRSIRRSRHLRLPRMLADAAVRVLERAEPPGLPDAAGGEWRLPAVSPALAAGGGGRAPRLRAARRTDCGPAGARRGRAPATLRRVARDRGGPRPGAPLSSGRPRGSLQALVQGHRVDGGGQARTGPPAFAFGADEHQARARPSLHLSQRLCALGLTAQRLHSATGRRDAGPFFPVALCEFVFVRLAGDSALARERGAGQPE